MTHLCTAHHKAAAAQERDESKDSEAFTFLLKPLSSTVEEELNSIAKCQHFLNTTNGGAGLDC